MKAVGNGYFADGQYRCNFEDAYDAGVKNLSQEELLSMGALASSKYIIGMLMRLAAHKTMKGSDEAKTFILEDLAIDLHGVCAGAVSLACQYFRRQEEPWFPTTGRIISAVRGFDESISSELTYRSKFLDEK